ncbi:MAG: tRNA pseudouridine(55) synthase TruB [Solirubrobacteraceae bacterium]
MISLEKLVEGSIVLIDKPLDWTSFDVANKIKSKIKHTYKEKIKVGHAGTLDPKATGLLIICTGKATKKIDEIQNQPKEYTGTFKLGATTLCYDTEMEENELFPTEHITEELIIETTNQFIGSIKQLPPIYSAIKVNGKKMYELAREGKKIEVKEREVTIYSFEITEINMPTISFKVKCSKGTYIRSLANDFGKTLNSGAYLTSLTRTAIGEYSIKQADNFWLAKE